MPKPRTVLISIPGGLQASLNLTSPQSALDSLMAACDQYQQRYHDLPRFVNLADSLDEGMKWLLRTWCDGHKIMWYAHYGEKTWLLMQPPEDWEVSHV